MTLKRALVYTERNAWGYSPLYLSLVPFKQEHSNAPAPASIFNWEMANAKKRRKKKKKKKNVACVYIYYTEWHAIVWLS
jgi:hypothetical protein